MSSSLPDGVNEKKIEEKLGAVSLTSRPVKTGKGQFSKIREEDREAADLAFQYVHSSNSKLKHSFNSHLDC